VKYQTIHTCPIGTKAELKRARSVEEAIDKAMGVWK